MTNKRAISKMVKKIIAGVCLVCMVVPGVAVNAEEEQKIIVREATGDLEELSAYQLPDDMKEEIPVAKSYRYAARTVTDSDVEEFLNYGGNYGYQDMTKRSNSEARQALYAELDAICKEFTAGAYDAEEYTNWGETFYLVGSTTQEDYELTAEELVEIYFTFRNDNPQYFWLANTVLYTSDSNIVILTYTVYQTYTERVAALEEIMNTMETVYESQITSDDSSYNKTLKVHDALIEDIEYSEDIYEEIAHSIAGAMTSEKSAVCEGYSKVMQLVLNRYNIPNIYVTGYGNGGGHAWNMVYMNDGNYYWLDATWDDQPYEEFQHDYFLVGNNSFTDHEADTPEGTDVDFLYELPTVPDDDFVYDPSLDVVTVIKGDINGDTKVNINDLMLCVNHVSKKQLLEGDAFTAADIDSDGSVSIKDLMRMVNYVSKKTSEL